MRAERKGQKQGMAGAQGAPTARQTLAAYGRLWRRHGRRIPLVLLLVVLHGAALFLLAATQGGLLSSVAQVAQGAAVKGSIGVSAEGEIALVRAITDKTSALMERAEALDKAVAAVPGGVRESARYCAGTVLPAMEAARAVADQLELLVDRSHWPFPTYRDLLFYV